MMTDMEILIIEIGLVAVFVVTAVLAVLYWRDHRRLVELDRALHSLLEQLDQLQGTRYVDLGSRMKNVLNF